MHIKRLIFHAEIMSSITQKAKYAESAFVMLNGQSDKRTKRRTDRHQESNLVHISVKIRHLVEIIFMIFLIIN